MTLINLPYESTGQQLGETRSAMGKRLMADLEDIINKYKDKSEKYYVLFHGKPWPNFPNVIKIKPIATNREPPMMLSCMCFEVDNTEGKLVLLWALPGSWPVYSLGGTVKPVPETMASIDKLADKANVDWLLPF